MRFLYLLIMFLASNYANAYPISPNALKKLISDSQVIVVAQVESIEVGRNEVIEFGGSVEIINELSKAHLHVLDVLKGNPESEITVMFDTFVICPTPAKYIEGSKVIAFLDRKPLENTYDTHARSYGLKELDNKGIDIYTQRIEEMEEILQMTDTGEQRKETIEWLVKCAENKVTRFEGVYDLNPQSEFMSYYDRNEDTFSNKYKLTDEQKQRLRTKLFSLDKLDEGDFGLIDIVKEGNDHELIQFLTTQYKAYAYPQFNLEQMYTIRTYMQYLSELTNNEKLISIYAEFDDNIGKFGLDKELLIELGNKFSQVLD